MAKSNVEDLFNVEAEVKSATKDYEPRVHTMVRSIATTAVPQGDSQPVYEVDADVSGWVERGYKLVSTHLIGVDANAINLVYILSK